MLALRDSRLGGQRRTDSLRGMVNAQRIRYLFIRFEKQIACLGFYADSMWNICRSGLLNCMGHYQPEGENYMIEEVSFLFDA